MEKTFIFFFVFNKTIKESHSIVSSCLASSKTKKNQYPLAYYDQNTNDNDNN